MKTRAILTSVLLLLACPSIAGVVYDIETVRRSLLGGEMISDKVIAQVEGLNIKIDIQSSEHGGDGEMIYRGDRREMIIVDHSDKSYILVDEARIQEVGEQLSGVEAQMAEAMKNVPEDQRAMVEQMMKQNMPQMMEQPKIPVIEVRKTDETGEKEGYPCVKFEVLRDGIKMQDLWVTEWSNIDGGQDTVGAFESMADFFEDLRSALPAFAQAGDNGSFDQMQRLGGFPVVTTDYADNGSIESESFLRGSRSEEIDLASFGPPADYRRHKMMP